MKNIYLLFALIGVFQLNAQVGINNLAPKASLDIKKGVPSGPDGLLIPRLDQSDVEAITTNLTTDHNSLMIYLNEASTDLTNQYINMDAPGYYYYDQPNDVWMKFIDTNTYTKPSGLENIADITGDFKWRYIDMAPDNYGTAGKYSTDLQYIPANLDTEMEGIDIPEFGIPKYSQVNLFNNSLPMNNLGATGPYSLTSGTMNAASGTAAVAMGLANYSQGRGAVAMGIKNNTNGTSSAAIGDGNTVSADYAYAIGRGNTVSGEGSFAIGLETEVKGSNSVAIGGGAKTGTETGSIAIGSAAEATGKHAIAIGPETKATGGFSVAVGNNLTASGLAANAFGEQTVASGFYSTAIGYGTQADSEGTFAAGSYNTIDTNAQPNSLDDKYRRAFVIGNGTNDTTVTPNVIERSDIFTVLRNGKTGINKSNFETVAAEHDAHLQVFGNTKTEGLAAEIKTGNTIEATDYTVILNANATMLAGNAENKGKIINVCTDDGSLRKISLTGGKKFKEPGSSVSFINLGGTTTPIIKCVNLQSMGDGNWWVIGKY